MAIFTAASLLTGYDGLGIGLRKVVPSLRTIVYVEREIFAAANLVAKIKEGKLDDAPIWDDITTFDGKPFAGLVDILHAGIPCQPWSVAGKQKGIADERWIWQDIFRVIVEISPRYIFLEEVPGFVRGGGFGYVLSDLAQARYDASWGCFTAAEVGAPHKRERLFILGYSGNCGLHRDTWRRSGEVAADGYLQLADTTQQLQYRRGETRAAGWNEHTNSRWPARPGQPQYEWEEPRTVKSGVGRTANEPSTRVDRLRLLGNGVVPATAEKAFRQLIKEIRLDK